MIRTSSPAGLATGLLAGLALPVVGGAVVAMAVVSLAAQPLWGDTAWYLYAAGRVLDGAHIGATDIVDVDPPLIIWLSEIPVALSRALGVLPETAMKLCLAPLVLLSAAWCASLIRKSEHNHSPAMSLWLAVVILYATTVHPWAYLGQREHLLVLFVLPYLVMAAIRLGGTSPATWDGVAAGLAAALGFSLKPQHLLIAAGVEALLAYRRGSLSGLLRPEVVSLVLGGGAYCAAVWIFAPEYLFKVVPFAYQTYLDYARVPLTSMLTPMRAAKVIGFVVLWALFRRRTRLQALSDVLVVAGLGASAAYLIQQKAISYLAVPAKAFFTVLIGVMLVEVWLRITAAMHQPVHRRLAGATVLATCLLVGSIYYPVQVARAANAWVNDHVTAQGLVTAALPRGTTVLFLFTDAVVFDFILDHHLRWASRFVNFWMLPAILESQARDSAASAPSTSAKFAGAARWARDSLVEDLKRWHPGIVLVERCVPHCLALPDLPRVDLLQWFREKSAFRAVWANYEKRREVGPYDLWCAKSAEALCQRALAAVPSAISSKARSASGS